ncbi:DNA cytosine methyltransferase [Nonomuraea sp. NPDC003754]
MRRLTPTETERLQGFPDGWTDVPGSSDAARYRQMGNALAVPVGEWLVRRLVEVDARPPDDDIR